MEWDDPRVSRMSAILGLGETVMTPPSPTSVQLYYFSGTGNARRLAMWVAEEVAKAGRPVECVSMDRLSARPSAPSEGTLVGFVFPVHGFTTLWFALKFILRFPRARGRASVFCMTSLGGCKIGPFLLPGWEGSGLVLPMVLLALKGYRWAGACPVRATPENWTSLLPGYGEAASRWMLARSKKRAETFIGPLLEGKRVFRGVVSAFVGAALIPFSVVYLALGRFFLAKTFFATTRCDGCGLCASNCPVGAIRMRGKTPFWTLSCESCMRCINYCPRRAIQAHLPFWLLLGVFLIHPWANQSEWAVAGRAPLEAAWVATLLGWAAYAVVFFAALVVFYRLWFWALRWGPLNRLFEFTTPTRWFHRYHEPDTTLGDYKKQ